MKKRKGSITVEAAFLLPLLILLILFVIWLAMYLHDRLVIENSLQRLYSRADDYFVYGTEPYDGHLPKPAMTKRGLLYAVSASEREKVKMQEWFYQELENRLFLFQTEAVHIEKAGLGLKADAYFHCRRPLLFSWLVPEEFTGLAWKRTVLFIVREELTRAVSVLLQSR